MGMLKLQRLRYEFTCGTPLFLHQELPTITLRGAFGYALAQVIARRLDINDLSHQVLAYRRIFMPQIQGNTNSHNRELSRPFVLRGRFTRPDRRSFLMEVILFGEAIPYEPIFDETIFTMAQMGLGIHRQECNVQKIFSGEITCPDPEPEKYLLLHFVSPCARLSSHGKVYRDEIPFGVLCARLIDRLEELIQLFGDHNALHSFEEIGTLKHMANDILWRRHFGGHYRINRLSGRTGDTICMDGFQGLMEYAGDFSPFREYLRYLPHVNVGRFSAFGCGWCRMAYQKIPFSSPEDTPNDGKEKAP